MVDPDPRTAGSGLRRLSDAGLDVSVGVEGAACQALNSPFVHRILEKVRLLLIGLRRVWNCYLPACSVRSIKHLAPLRTTKVIFIGKVVLIVLLCHVKVERRWLAEAWVSIASSEAFLLWQPFWFCCSRNEKGIFLDGILSYEYFFLGTSEFSQIRMIRLWFTYIYEVVYLYY